VVFGLTGGGGRGKEQEVKVRILYRNQEGKKGNMGKKKNQKPGTPLTAL